MKWASMVAVGFAGVVLVGAAKADPKATVVGSHPATYTTHVVDIVGRNLRPMVVVEVRKVEPALTVTGQTPPVAGRVGEAVAHDPF